MTRAQAATWTARDQARALRQGWGLFRVPFLGGPILTIQQADEHGRFPTGEAGSIAAAAYVAGRAEAGDARAKKALKLISTAGRMIGSLRDPNKLIA